MMNFPSWESNWYMFSCLVDDCCIELGSVSCPTRAAADSALCDQKGLLIEYYER
jgi:hypothetical protein